MKNTIKLLLGTLFLLPSLIAQTYVSDTLLTNTPVALITTPAVIKAMTMTATTANATVFKFYDYNSTTSTNVVYAATTAPLSYSTNWSTTFTNTQGIVLTNTFSGLYTTTTVVTAVTNERPRVITITVPASSQRTITLSKRLAYGLVGQANYAGLVEVEYDPAR